MISTQFDCLATFEKKRTKKKSKKKIQAHLDAIQLMIQRSTYIGYVKVMKNRLHLPGQTKEFLKNPQQKMQLHYMLSLIIIQTFCGSNLLFCKELRLSVYEKHP